MALERLPEHPIAGNETGQVAGAAARATQVRADEWTMKANCPVDWPRSIARIARNGATRAAEMPPRVASSLIRESAEKWRQPRRIESSVAAESRDPWIAWRITRRSPSVGHFGLTVFWHRGTAGNWPIAIEHQIMQLIDETCLRSRGEWCRGRGFVVGRSCQ